MGGLFFTQKRRQEKIRKEKLNKIKRTQRETQKRD